MIITREQQLKAASEYSKEGHNTDQYLGFIDGMNKMWHIIAEYNRQEQLRKN